MSWNAEISRSAKTLSASRHYVRRRLLIVASLLSFLRLAQPCAGQTANASTAKDPGVRGGPPAAGSAIAGLTPAQQSFFQAGLMNFALIDSVTGSMPATGNGLGPRFNAESCAQCHAHPATGGSSPAVNPQLAAAIDQGALNQIPSFITVNGPVREARFPYTSDLKQADGGVHDLFTISGRTDASGCNIAQPNFQQAAAIGNLIFRIPTPAFGGGLIEAISDSAILANAGSNASAKQHWGIAGRPNRTLHDGTIDGTANSSGNDGTITRFGWKAQNKSLEMFSGEAYNVEMGVSNELFPNERDETPGCLYNGTPEDHTNFDLNGTAQPSDIVRFTAFMRMLDQPQPAPPTPSTIRGQKLFTAIGCALCHTPSYTTGQSSVAALSNIQANLFSDLLLHHMGPQLADNIVQGQAAGDEFRTAPLWGLGQRLFFLHDGRTGDLVTTILGHAGKGDHRYPDSEANAVINNYKRLSEEEQQDLLNFLRSL